MCAFPYILAFTPDSMEIRLIINGNLVQTMVMPKLKLITSKVNRFLMIAHGEVIFVLCDLVIYLQMTAHKRKLSGCSFYKNITKIFSVLLEYSEKTFPAYANSSKNFIFIICKWVILFSFSQYFTDKEIQHWNIVGISNYQNRYHSNIVRSLLTLSYHHIQPNTCTT